MTVELQVANPEAPAANKAVLAILRELLKHARAGEIQSLVVGYMQDGAVGFDYEIEEGHELTMASVCREIDTALRDEAFASGD